MITRCIFCYREFPANEMLEHFPLGRRVAFDPERGRLWATCESCRRWTLAPIEDRWEALEELEKLTTDLARLLAQTDNISLLKAEKMEIVRIGRASLSEQSWWRFGRELMSRHKSYQRASLIIIAGIVALQIGVTAAIGGGVAYAYMFTGGIQDWLKKRKFGKDAWRGQGQCPNCGAKLGVLKFDHRKKLIIAPGENDSQTTSAQRTRSRINPRDSGLVMSRVSMRLPALQVWKSAAVSGPSPAKGRMVRHASRRVVDSTRITVAP